VGILILKYCVLKFQDHNTLVKLIVFLRAVVLLALLLSN